MQSVSFLTHFFDSYNTKKTKTKTRSSISRKCLEHILDLENNSLSQNNLFKGRHKPHKVAISWMATRIYIFLFRKIREIQLYMEVSESK